MASFTFELPGGAGGPAPDKDANEEHRASLTVHWKQRVHNELLERLDLKRLSELQRPEAVQNIRDASLALFNELNAPISLEKRNQITREIIDEVLGLGPLEKLLKDSAISDILVNGYDTVYIERHGVLEQVSASFRDNDHLINVIEKIVSNIGRRIDESSPMVDARLPDGSRVNAIIPPLSLDGPLLSIRRPTVDMMVLQHLVDLESLSREMMECLRAIVQLRLNIMISGGTGSGKTTLLNALSSFISNRERIITIEDSAELQLQQKHVVRLETRLPNLEGKGEVTARDLVRNSLRMRPDRIILGEIRGAEALDMMTAMNTGHDGSLTSVHANNPRDALQRLTNMLQMTGIPFTLKSLNEQIASAINIVVHMERQEDGRRRIVSIQEINGSEKDVISMTEIFRFQRSGHDDEGNVIGRFVATGMIPDFYNRLKIQGIELPRSIFMQNTLGG